MGGAASGGNALMNRFGHRRMGLLVLVALVLGRALPAAGQERYGLVISGASGDPTYAENYDRWRTALVLTLRDRFRFREDNLTVLAEQASAGVGIATRESVRKSLSGFKAKLKREDLLIVVLIGHGTYDGTDAKFNLVGPDIDASEWKTALVDMPGRLVMVNTTSASFPFLQALAGKGRVVITATDSTAQRYETVFPEAFVEALDAVATDLDKNGKLSLWELFTAASTKVKAWYEQRGQLSTERPILDDTGDGVGKEAGAPGPDGEVARLTYLDPVEQLDVSGDAELAELVRKRSDLEAEVDGLKGRRESMPPAQYQQELERLLVELARVSREIRNKS
jgi:hypothetical protein